MSRSPEGFGGVDAERGGAGVLYLIATPLGHREDITLRALRILREVDLVAAEDTRRSRNLLASHGIRARLISYHEHNERRRARTLLEHLRAGRSVAVVTNAGSPLISDPGYHLVQAAIGRDVRIEVIPGPSAPIAALQVAGFTADRFVFHGFLPRAGGRRERWLDEIARDARTQVAFETPHRIHGTLEAMARILGERHMVLCRELTKLHEEILRGSAGEILARMGKRPVKGEMVLVVGPLARSAGG